MTESADERSEEITLATKECRLCGRDGRVPLTLEQADAWDTRTAGTPVQDVLPNMSVELREQIISGTHPKCWDALVDIENRAS